MIKTVFKVQQPISTNDPENAWLFYDKHRKHAFMMPEKLVPAELSHHMGKRNKMYALCGYNRNTHTLRYIEEVSDANF